jgi:glycerophosphoryl diester phosphodiesterase
MANKEQEKKMIDIKVKNNKAKIEIKGKPSEVLFEMALINKTFYETLEKKGDPVAILSFEVSMMELITGKTLSKDKVIEWIKISNVTDPELADQLINALNK